mmetsp:Transcript_926/g.1442  ORF Transcript_926/g.1442 Transcript_926/m.1442 type:complete len:80 (-) Transcript_926:1295-1534(-)
MIRSASCTVESLWAIMIVVLPLPRALIWWMISASVSVSRAEVASSQKIIGESFRIARAIATRCFSPPDNFRPRSPTMLS